MTKSIARSTGAAGASQHPANESTSSHYSHPAIKIEFVELSDLPKNEGDYAYARLTSGEHDKHQHAVKSRYEVLYEATCPQGHSLEAQSSELRLYEEPKLLLYRVRRYHTWYSMFILLAIANENFSFRPRS